MTDPEPPPGRLRADAQRNAERIRVAALEVFRAGGLGHPLDEVARAAGVSKGTIYHRYGGRQGLIDAVVEELVAERIDGIVAEAARWDDPGDAFESYLRLIWMLQYDEPAANDVLLRSQLGSPLLASLCERANAFAARLLAAAQAFGAVRSDLAPEDLSQLIRERGVIARDCHGQPRAAYERTCAYMLHGLRASAAQDGRRRKPAAPAV